MTTRDPGAPAGPFRKLATLFRPGAHDRPIPADERKEAFETIAREGRWGEVDSSGAGSTEGYTRVARQILEKVIRDYGIGSMLDVGCGDFAWMPLVLERLPPGFHYIGGDIVPRLIERNRAVHEGVDFRVVDFVTGELPEAELIFCRDVVQHLPIPDAKALLANASRSGARYLLTTTHLRRWGWRNRRNKRVGGCNDRNLMLPPFNLPDPLVIYAERDPAHKFLGLWELPFAGDPATSQG